MNEIKVEPYIPDEDYDNPAMVVDFYEFTMANCLFLHGFKNTTLVFDMFFRKNPDNQGYSISAGQRKLTRFLLDYHFNEQDIHWLRTKGMSEEFCEYLRTYKWKGDMYALPEGTVCYPHVQMVRIECDLVGAILIETYLLQTMNFHSLIATKATRVTGLNTHTPRNVMEFGTRRAQGESAGNDGAYAAVLGGCIGTANCLAEMKFGAEVKAVGTVAHSFIEFFPTEFDAFKAFADTYPDSVSLLLDTYNIMESGLPNLIKLDDYLIEKYPNDPNRRVKSARIDSGDLARLHQAGGLQRSGREENRQHGTVRARTLRLLRRGREPHHLRLRPRVWRRIQAGGGEEAGRQLHPQDEVLGLRQQGYHPGQEDAVASVRRKRSGTVRPDCHGRRGHRGR